MIKDEWKYLLKNKLMVIVFVVMIFIPSIYSVTFLKSMWNPYGELKNLPVAVINNDKPIKYQGTELTTGQDLTKNLEKSQALDFKLVDSKQKAQLGLKNGKYYMIITIPKDFSKNVTTLLNKHPHKMVLHYETSAGHNFTASKMTASAAQKVAETVSQQVTKTYSKTMFKSIKQLSKGMTTATKGGQTLVVGDSKLISANQQVTTGLNTLANSSLTFENGATTLTQGLDQYISGVNQVASGSQTLTNGLKQLSSKTVPLAKGIGSLANGSANLNSAIENYTAGVDSLNSSTEALTNGANSLDKGTSQLASSSATLNSGLSQLQTASQNLTTNLQKVSSGLTNNTSSLSSSLNDFKEALTNENNLQATKLTNDLTTVQQILVKQKDSQNSLSEKVATIADQQGLTATQKSAILDTITNNNNNDVLNQAVTSLTNDIKSFNTQNNSSKFDQLASSITNSQTELTTVISQLGARSQQLTTQLGSAADGMKQLNNGLSTINNSTSQLAQGANKLTSGTSQLAANSSHLTSGSTILHSGIASMNVQMPDLTTGISQLTGGANSLNSGVSQLATKGSKLTSGSNQLANGASKLSEGSKTLANGSEQLGSGLAQVNSGNQSLAKQLAVGAEKSDIKATNLTYDQIAKPTTSKQTERDSAPNNGTGMAPYMLSVSLFVGALAFNLMFDTYSPRKFPKNGFAWWLSKSSLTGTFALGESLAIFLLVSVIDGLKPVQGFATFLMLLLTSLTFMSIVYWLNLVLGKVGSFLSMILLVFQLGGSAGTYPIQLSNGFFNSIHPWLPMSYTVSGLRQTLMIGDSALPEMLTLLAITVVFSFLSISFFIRRKAHLNKIDFTREAAKHSLV